MPAPPGPRSRPRRGILQANAEGSEVASHQTIVLPGRSGNREPDHIAATNGRLGPVVPPRWPMLRLERAARCGPASRLAKHGREQAKPGAWMRRAPVAMLLFMIAHISDRLCLLLVAGALLLWAGSVAGPCGHDHDGAQARPMVVQTVLSVTPNRDAAACRALAAASCAVSGAACLAKCAAPSDVLPPPPLAAAFVVTATAADLPVTPKSAERQPVLYPP